MGRYKVQIKPSAAKEIEDIPEKSGRRKVVARIQALADNPRPPGSQKLAGQERYRVRQGWYRNVYTVEDREATVHVVKVGHRKDVYQ